MESDNSCADESFSSDGYQSEDWEDVVVKPTPKRCARAWDTFCTFPPGHALKGVVPFGSEMKMLEERFSPEFYSISPSEVKQVCPCGKTECDLHIFPSTVLLESSFLLAVYTQATLSTPKQTHMIEHEFRKQHAMTVDEAKTFFERYKLKWEVHISSEKITFQMICRCGKAFEQTPCDACHKKARQNCALCGSERKKNMLKSQHPSKNSKLKICSDCKANEVTYCEFCKDDKSLAHECKPLLNSHVSFRKNKIHRPLMHTAGSDMGICPYCKEGCSRRTYSRHWRRRHNDLKPAGFHTHRAPRHFCDYCDLYFFETSSVRDHVKMHLIEEYPCRLGCGKKFNHACAEIQHRRKFHKQDPPTRNRLRRVGDTVVRISRKSKKQKLDPEL